MAVLYRKYRPQSFAEVIGQEHVVQTLTNSLKNANISHAYLFCGPRGSGKTTIARLFAKAVNCLARKATTEGTSPHGAEPCNKCISCEEISAGKSIDLIEIDAASHRGIDDIRELREGIKFAPVSSKYKIFIIDECHQLSKDASNALLKTLEEPPSHAIFILATTEAQKMIPTIVSRCQRFDFKRLQTIEITKKLLHIAKKEGITLNDSAVSIIALNARGSFRDAESILDQCISFAGDKKEITSEDIKSLLGLVEMGQVSGFVEALLKKDTKKCLESINQVLLQGGDLQEFTKTLIFYLRQLLITKIDPDFFGLQNVGLTEKESNLLKEQSAGVSQVELQKITETFIEAENKIKYSPIIQLPLELAVIGLT